MIKLLALRTTTAMAGLAALVAVSLTPTAHAQGSSAPSPRQCKVSIDRSADAGDYSVVRQEFKNSRCICAITTGPRSQAASVEEKISALVTNRTCADATAVAMAPGQGGLSKAFLAAGAGGLAIAGLVTALNDDDDRPVSP